MSTTFLQTPVRYFMKKMTEDREGECVRCLKTRKGHFQVQDNFGRVYFYYCKECSDVVVDGVDWSDGAEVPEEWVLCNHSDDPSLYADTRIERD